MRPRVSVAITTFNQAAYIGATIRSVLEQTYTNLEIVVVDDGSTDETPVVVAQFGDRVRYIRQANRGVAGARNRAVEAATGELIALLDGDDLWDPPKIARQVELFDRYPHLGLVAVDFRHFSDAGVLGEGDLREMVFDAAATTPYVVGDFHRQFIERNLIATTSQVMIPAAVLRTVGHSRETLLVGSDYDLYLRIASTHQVAFINDVLTAWRFLETSASGRAGVRQLRWKSDSLEVLRLHARGAGAAFEPAIMQRRLELMKIDLAWSSYQAGCRGETQLARMYLWQVMKSGLIVRPAAYYVAISLPASWRAAARGTVQWFRSIASDRPA